jgi:NAD(P)-dependent dehydrogenase (short-subunit alcohol dehydrogenase family)
MYKNLKNKTVIITGGNGFLGQQISNAFYAAEANVVIIDKIKKNNINKKFQTYRCDITNERNLKKTVYKILKKNRSIDILVNNAASNHNIKNKIKNFENFDLKVWENDLAVGLTGSFLCTKIIGGIMSKQKNGGNILNISSDLGIIAPDQRLYNHTNFKKPVSYSVVKTGLIGLTKYTASYWARNKVRCNAFAPGGILNKQNKLFLKKIKNLIPLNRMAKKNEYNDTILFLCSNSSSYITGAVIVADGGRTII